MDTDIVSAMTLPVVPGPVHDWLRNQPRHYVYTTTITQAEIATGIASLPRGRRRAELAYRVRMLWEEQFADRILDFGSAAAAEVLECASLRLTARRPIAVPDVWIAALGRLHGATIVTRNTRDFEHCGVSLFDPWSAPNSP
ncbi:MAG TPA: PIN domain-containing protein [Terriglobales bacterium]|nr:PIN domain-containing protein [Terriglobales bacterium]